MKNKKQAKIETIFDHNPTERELLIIAPEVLDGDKEKDDYILTLNQDTHYSEIVRLYKWRDDPETAEKYYLMISEKERKRSEKMAKETIIA